jgi:hypothetical protein
MWSLCRTKGGLCRHYWWWDLVSFNQRVIIKGCDGHYNVAKECKEVTWWLYVLTRVTFIHYDGGVQWIKYWWWLIMRAQPNVRIFIIREKVICKEKLDLGQKQHLCWYHSGNPQIHLVISKYYKYPMLRHNQGLWVQILHFLGFIWPLRDLGEKEEGANVGASSAGLQNSTLRRKTHLFIPKSI